MAALLFSLPISPLLPPILHNPVPCGKATGRRTQFGRSTSGRLLPTGRKNADGFLGDAHDAAHGLIVHAHFVEDEEEGIVSDLLIICKSRGARCNICVKLCTFADEEVNKSTFYVII